MKTLVTRTIAQFSVLLVAPLTLTDARGQTPPESFQAVPGHRQVMLAWDPASNATGFNVRSASSPYGPWTAIATNVRSTSFVVTNLANGVNYYFTVSSLCDGFESVSAPTLRAIPSAAVLDLLPAGAKLERLATSFGFTEGPVWMPETGGALVFSDLAQLNRNTCALYRWTSEGGTTLIRRPSNLANGNARDRDGGLITCEAATGRLVRTETNGTVTVLVDTYNGVRFNGPNDVVVKSDGTIWFTDPVDTSINPQRQPWPAVYRFDPLAQEVKPVATNFTASANYPNGLCFSPDESMIYVADFLGRKILLYDVLSDGTLTNSRVFAQNIGSGYPQGPDGIRCDRTGRLYSTLANAGTASGLRVYSPGGQLLTTLLTPESPANLSFGGADGEMLFITANSSIYAITHLPDLTVTGIYPVPANPVAGQRVAFRAVVKNQGTGSVPVGAAIQVAFSVGSLTNFIWSGSFTGGLPADSSIVLAGVAGATGSQWLASPGSHIVFATVDVNREVTESLEQNNVFLRALDIVPLPPDTDGDGMSDANEETAGTDPSDPNSVLRILSAQVLNGDTWVLTWTSVPGKSYRIARQTSLDNFQWATSSDVIVATLSTCSWTNLSGFGNGPAFFRIVVTP